MCTYYPAVQRVRYIGSLLGAGECTSTGQITATLDFGGAFTDMSITTGKETCFVQPYASSQQKAMSIEPGPCKFVTGQPIENRVVRQSLQSVVSSQLDPYQKMIPVNLLDEIPAAANSSPGCSSTQSKRRLSRSTSTGPSSQAGHNPLAADLQVPSHPVSAYHAPPQSRHSSTRPPHSTSPTQRITPHRRRFGPDYLPDVQLPDALLDFPSHPPLDKQVRRANHGDSHQHFKTIEPNAYTNTCE